ncbi:hypothetical protein SOVF_153440 [Spinacia oleracea]|nr:hypothetical protein SOVF_153440 [Spinacia oleracea]
MESLPPCSPPPLPSPPISNLYIKTHQFFISSVPQATTITAAVALSSNIETQSVYDLLSRHHYRRRRRSFI